MVTAGNRIVEDLIEWLRIPSVSTDQTRPAELRRAADWVCRRVAAGGGIASLAGPSDAPLVVGRLAASSGSAAAPTVLLYGHYDVQDPGATEDWTTPPFEPSVRHGRLYARGAADDKGNFLTVLHAACELATEGRLPVNVRLLVEGEEETTSAAAVDWIATDQRVADCAVVFDSAMADERTPALTVGLRGIVIADVDVRTATRDLHSGEYGGTVHNAAHVLHRCLAAVLPDDSGRVPDALCDGVQPATELERSGWSRLPAGSEVIRAAGAAPLIGAEADFYERVGAAPGLDVNGVWVGARRSVIPATASARLSLRLAAGQQPQAMAGALRRLLASGTPDQVELSVRVHTAEPVRFDPSAPALRIAAEALEQACGIAPVLLRAGTSIPVVSALAARGVPAIVTGFSVDADRIHAVDESFRLDALQLGCAAAEVLITRLGDLPTS